MDLHGVYADAPDARTEGERIVEGFFSPAAAESATRRPLSLIPKCGACGLYQSCQSPKIPVGGSGRKGILLVGDVPAKTDDERGKHFADKYGTEVADALREFGIRMEKDCWLTNALICRPDDTEKEQMIEWCRPNLVHTIRELDPSVIILFGQKAVRGLIGWLWKEQVGDIGRWVGWQIPSQRLNAYVCPTWHPNHVARTEKDNNHRVVKRLWLRHIERAVSLTGRPFAIKRDLAAGFVEVMPDVRQAASVLLTRFNATQRPVAFDLETTTLKPDSDKAQIYTCAMSDGKRTIAYPWAGPAVEASIQVFRNKEVPKIGYNIKFEERWLRMKHGIRIANWLICGMTAAHVLDPRPGITSLKFQSFILLGADSYNDEVGKYLHGDGGHGLNRIKEAPLDAVLKYNGLDALYERQVGMKQAPKVLQWT